MSKKQSITKNQNDEAVPEVTIDELGKWIKEGFDGLGQRIGGLETRFNGLEQRFDRLEQRFDGLELRFDGLEKKMDFRFTGIQNQLDNMSLDHVTRREHGLIVDRVKRVERKVGIKVTG